ncbi:MAG: hypothetical protein K2K90_16670 [Lachnospiraceae bacterium]|nr:hypothetical protein [Lachnospiraceae bacterium]
MGRTKKLYLAKRMLAMILAAAMSITMVPQTVFAAPAGDTAVEDIVDAAAEGNGDVDTPENEDGSEDTGDIVSDGAAADDADDGASGVGDVKDTDGTADAANNDADDVMTDGDVEKTNKEPVDGGNAEVKNEPNAEGDTSAAVYEISVDDMETEAVYDGYTPFDPDSAVLKKTENGETTVVTGVTLTSSWKVQGGDGNFTALTGEPVNVGVYELTLTCAAVANVHAETVRCEIKKAPLTVRATATAKPGDKADKANVTVAVSGVEPAEGDSFGWTTDDIALEVKGVREAFGSSLTADDVLKENGDYVVDVTPSLKADAAEAVKEAAKNYTFDDFTADVAMAELAETEIEVTLTEKWKETNAVTLHVYDGAEAAVPALTVDYTYVVKYLDDTGEWKIIDGAEAVGEWEAYTGSEVDGNGKVKAPTDAGEYTYILNYEDKNGKYAKSQAEITVVIDPAPVTVELANDTTKELTVPAGTLMTKVLSQVKYKATSKNRSGAAVTIDAKKNHIWGTGYDDKNVSQIYEPAFTLQVKDGDAWKDISDAAYRMEGGKEYRVIYDGKKAIYNSDGTYAHRTDINSGLDENGEEINGVDANYITDKTPTADANALKVVAQAGVEMEWDLTALLADGKANEKLGKDAVAKDYDDKALYEKKADYKNKVKLKGAGKTLDAVGSDFTYTWYKNTAADDLLDIEIADQNKANGFAYDDYEQSWGSPSSIAPTNAGVYKLEIMYEDNTDDDTFYYVKEGKAAEVYFVINKVQLEIVPEGTYEALEGRTPREFFVQEKKIDDLNKAYKVLKDGNAYTFPESLGEVVPQWGVLENIAGESGVDTTWYPENSEDIGFSTGTGYSYDIQARALGRRYYENGEYDGFFSTVKIRNNYTLYKSEIKVAEDGGKNRAYRDDTLLSGKAALKINPVGTTRLELVAKAPLAAYEKTYNGKALTRAEVKPEEDYTLTANGQPVEDPGIEYMCVNTETGDWCMLEDQRDAGKYDLYACFWGSETYAPLDLGENPDGDPGVKIATVTIRKCQISLELDVDDTYEAGYMEALWSDIGNYKVTAYEKNEEWDDEWAFSAGGYAWGNLEFYVNKAGSKTRLYEGEILHRDGDFEIHYDADNSYLNWPYSINYEVKNAAEVLDTFKTVAAPAGIRSAKVGNVQVLDIAAPEVKRNNDGSITQTVNVLEGIPYTTYGIGADAMKGNLAAFSIYAPEEFGGRIPDTAMYKNEVEGIGGKVVSTYSNRFVVLFDAAEGEKTVNIRWADKYIETIILKLDEKLCLGDLTKAVAPKSLAFNVAPKKLAVGESAQLDVKITKLQMTDVVCLGYESDHPEIIHVDPDSGYVTALRKDKATITVYPKQMDKDGKMVRIPGFKAVTVTIEGTALTAPKSVKVTPRGNEALVNYDRVVDGYRREIYVVDNTANPTLKKASDIEAKVKEMQGNKNQWRGTFAIAPIYLDSADENYGRSWNGIWYKAWLSGLQSETPYTVYVRNVCEAKTLPDGYMITQETVDLSAAGTAVSFKSLKSEVTALELELDETLDGIDYMGDGTYRVELPKFAKGLDSKTFGLFYQNVSDKAADGGDQIRLELPLKDKNSVYQDPKLEYYVFAEDKNGYSGKALKNEFVSVDKKGKIKLTGVTGWAYHDADEDEWYYDGGINVYVRDSSTGTYTYIKLVVVADVDSVTAKKKTMNLTVGQGVDLNDIALYTYKAGKNKLTSYKWPDMDMDAVRTAVKAQSEYFELEDTTLRAIKAGGTLKLALTDKTVEKNAQKAADATAEITFSSKELAPVKKIKAFDITNDKFGLTFTSAGYPDAFRVEIRDSSNNMLLDKRYEVGGEVYRVKERAKDRGAWVNVKDTYGIDAYTIQNDVEAGGRRRLAKESQYTVKITALYGGVASKEATAKVKTTKIPAVSDGLNDNDPENWYWNDEKKSWYSYLPRGGMSIQVSESNWNLSYGSEGLYVLSGNSYTLTAEPTNRGRVNDTLVWTVGDKKVASVKAAAGTYCITLKGMQPGYTTLEVKSKILGKVIARYDIYVAAVGDAYKNDNGRTRYYGDDEPENPGGSYNPGHEGDGSPDYLPLSVDDRRKTKDNKYRNAGYDYGYCSFFSFMAPETGKYRFSTGNNYSVYLQKRTEKYGDWSSGSYGNLNLNWLEKGQTVYLRSQNYNEDALYYVEIGLTQRMEAAENGKTVTGQGEPASFEFKAPETGQYQFSLTYGNNSKVTLYLYTNMQDAMNQSYTSSQGSTVEARIQEGDSVWLTTRNSVLTSGVEYTLNAKKISEDVAFGTPKTVTLTAGETKYLMYAIEKSGRYQFSSTADTVSYSVLSNITVGDEVKLSINSANFTKKLELNQGDVVCVKVTNNGSADVTFTVNTADITPTDLSAVTGDVKINGGDTFYSFTASAAGAYKFTLTVDQANASDVELKIWNSVSDPEDYRSPLATGTDGDPADNKVTISADILLAAGQTVYVNPINNSGSELTVGVAGAKDDSIPEINASGTNIALQANQKMKAIFTADSTGIYEFITTGELNGDVYFTLAKGENSTENIRVPSNGALSKKVVLKSGQAVLWTMEAADEVSFSLCAELTDTLEELKLGQAAQASVLGSNDAPDGQATAAGFVFTVPEDGDYTFWSEADFDTYGYLYDINKVDAGYCLLYSDGSNRDYLAYDDDSRGYRNNFAIEYELQKGTVVYLKCRAYEESKTGSFPVYVEQGSQPWNN